MRHALSCGDAMPGCSARFEEDRREQILELVAAHAREAHGVTDVTPDLLQTMGATSSPPEPRSAGCPGHHAP
jgi:predicted small metal-binding protein